MSRGRFTAENAEKRIGLRIAELKRGGVIKQCRGARLCAPYNFDSVNRRGDPMGRPSLCHCKSFFGEGRRTNLTSGAIADFKGMQKRSKNTWFWRRLNILE